MLHPLRNKLLKDRSHIMSLKNLRSISKRSFRRRKDDTHDDDTVRKSAQQGREEDGLILYKSRGQHLLTNSRILDTILSISHVRDSDTVLEIGPGTGNLTLKLLRASRHVVAVEIDKRMVEILGRRVAERGLRDRITVICGDAMKTDFPSFDLVVANIPYGISSPLIAKLVFGPNRFRSATLLLQKEFARRLLADPGDPEFNRLAANVKLVADVDFVMDVSKREFIPPPKVDSSVVVIRPKPSIPDVDMDEWLAFTRTCFGKKNKTLGATLKQKKKVGELMVLSKAVCGDAGATSFKDRIVGILKSSGFEDRRPSKLGHQELLHLLSLFNQAGVFFHDHAKTDDLPDDS